MKFYSLFSKTHYAKFHKEGNLMTNDLEIRIATVDDAKALLEIYSPYVKNTAITFEYEVF